MHLRNGFFKLNIIINYHLNMENTNPVIYIPTCCAGPAVTALSSIVLFNFMFSSWEIVAGSCVF